MFCVHQKFALYLSWSTPYANLHFENKTPLDISSLPKGKQRKARHKRQSWHPVRVSVPRPALTKLVSWSLCALSVLSLPDLRTVSLWFRKTLWRKPRDTYIYFLLNLCCFLGIHVNAEWFDKCLWFIHPVMHGFSFFSKVLYLLIDEWLFKWIWEN